MFPALFLWARTVQDRGMMGLLPLMLAAAAWSGTVEHRTAFGSMTLIQEEWTRDPDQPPMIQAPNAWKKLHLRWQAPTGGMTVELTDDGQFLEFAIKGYDCSRMSWGFRYNGSVGEPGLWREMTQGLRDFAKTCPRIPAEHQASNMRAFAGAGDDFIPGIEALKKRATPMLGPTLKRCRPRTRPLASPYDTGCDSRW